MNKRQYKKLVKVMRTIKPCRDKYRKNAILFTLDSIYYCHWYLLLFQN